MSSAHGKVTKGLGRSLLKNRRKKLRAHRGLAQKPKGSSSGGDYVQVHRASPKQKQGLLSVIEQTDLDDFLEAAELSKRQFEAQRGEMVLVQQGGTYDDGPTIGSRGKLIDARKLPVPRRPHWVRGETSHDELRELEDDIFLSWRRRLAHIEAISSCVLTPFERNPQVWRQLWRVLERSDLIIQIVDARNPLLYRCTDLELYASELGKPTMLLVNKADYLTDAEREDWARWFEQNGVDAAFFSAHAAQAELDESGGAGLGRAPPLPPIEEDGDGADEAMAVVGPPDGGADGGVESDEDGGIDGPAPLPWSQSKAKQDTLAEWREAAVLLDRTGLIRRLQKFALRKADADLEAEEMVDDGRSTYSAMEGIACTVGTVGYPNVGKSSVINVLMGVTTADLGTGARVSVGATPGRTKHYQTHRLRNEDDCDYIEVCDCPGLVFPSAVHSKADLILSGVLSVDQMRDFRGAHCRERERRLWTLHATYLLTYLLAHSLTHTHTRTRIRSSSDLFFTTAPINLMVQQLPRSTLEEMYGIKLTPSLTAQRGGADRCTGGCFMDTLADARSFRQGKHSGPDQSRAARVALKDYVTGRLVYAHPPPDAAEYAVGGELEVKEDENAKVQVGDAAAHGRAEQNEDAALESQFEAALFFEMQAEIQAEKAAVAEKEREAAARAAAAQGATISKKGFKKHYKQARKKNRSRGLDDVEAFEKIVGIKGFKEKGKKGKRRSRR